MKKSAIFLSSILMIFGLFLSDNNVEAATASIGSSSFSYRIDKTVYLPGETMTAKAAWTSCSGCDGTSVGRVAVGLPVELPGGSSKYMVTGYYPVLFDYTFGQKPLGVYYDYSASAPTTPGNYSALFILSDASNVSPRFVSYTVRDYTCTGSVPSGSIACSGDSTGLTSDLPWLSVGTSSAGCTATRKCQYYTPSYSCTGITPANADFCPNDNVGLTADTPRTVVSSCGAPKCEYTCKSGYTKSGNSCVPINYSCTGITPANADFCLNDNVGLTADTPRTVVSSCGAPKCEYTCKSGYIKSGNSCVPSPSYFCTGTTPANANFCPNDNVGLTANTPRTVVSSCGAPKCEYTCKSGYTKSGDSCVPISYSCTGTTPANADFCLNDNIGLTADTPRTVVSSCGAPKCEYTCKSGYVKSGNSCVLAQYSCTGTISSGSIMCSGDSTGLTSDLPWAYVGTSSSGCTTTRKCQYYKPIVNYSCTGSVPSGSTACSGDSTGLTSNLPWAYVGTSSSSCTTTRKCQYYTPPTNNLPVGRLADISCSNGTLTAWGWAYDEDILPNSINVRFYNRDNGSFLGSVTADNSSPDLGVAGNHRFNDVITTGLSSETYNISAWAINSPSGTNPQLNNSPQSVTCSPAPLPTVTLTASPSSVSSGGSSTLTWNTTNASSCWGWYDSNSYWDDGDGDSWKDSAGGTDVETNITSTRTYHIKCWNDNNDFDEDSVTVIAIPVVINGACGTRAGIYSYDDSGYAGVWCSFGSVDSEVDFPDPGTTSSWYCLGSGPGSSDSPRCDAVRESSPSSRETTDWREVSP